MDAQQVVLGIVAFIAVVALGGVFGLRKAISDLREFVKLRNSCREREIEGLSDNILALKGGMEELGMTFRPKETKPGAWVKKETDGR